MEFECRYTYENGTSGKWTGSWELINHDRSVCELKITGRGSSFQCIIGFSSTGLYACFPLIDVGCGLAGFSDTFWNIEKLSSFVSVTDAVTIAEAIKSFGKYY